jgi:predicted signal transduction protein with EAL and GGDEF domain
MVVAEGVESEEIWSDLPRLECELAQGYYLSRPTPGAGLPDCLRVHGAVAPLALRREASTEAAAVGPATLPRAADGSAYPG